MATHLIHQQNLHLSFLGEMKPEALSVRLSRWQTEKLLPAMEAVLNQADSPHYRIRIETINIDAGETEGNNWEDVLVEKICRLLKQELREAATKTFLPFETSAGETVPSFYSKTEKQNLLFTYLKTGRLAWYATVDVSELMQWFNDFIEDEFFSEDASLNLFKENSNAFQRFLRQAKPAWLEQWSNQWLTRKQKESVPDVLLVARKLFGQSHTALEWTFALLFDGRYPSLKPLWQSYLQEDEPSFDVFIRDTKSFLQQSLPAKEWQTRFAELKAKPVKKRQAIEQASDGDDFFISNAGLVLLHPFLKQFFTNLHLLNEKREWLNDAGQHRAVLLLHFLGNGKTEAADYDLPLCKLLAGFPIDMPVEAAIEVSDDEKDEAMKLLQTVITQWSVLKTTSIEGLQESFLQRDGKLKKGDNGWLLQVEQKAYDVLLSHLPWSIGVIKTPWMNDLLFTEWT